MDLKRDFPKVLSVREEEEDLAISQVLAMQEQQANLYGLSGLLSHQDNSSARLEPPLPRLSLQIGPASSFPLSLQQMNSSIVSIVRLQRLFRKLRGVRMSRETIWNFQDARPFIPRPLPPPPVALFSSVDGLQLYIDAARFLPDNVTLTAVEAFVTDSAMKDFYGKMRKEIDPRSPSLSSPIFNARKEIWIKEGSEWNPTSTVLVQINALERRKETFTTSIVGFSVLNVFVDPTTKEQPKSAQVSEFVLNEGSFQLPIFRSGVPQGQPLSLSSMARSPRRFCSSLLVRIVKSARKGQRQQQEEEKAETEGRMEARGALVRPQPYSQGVYSNESLCEPSEQELLLFPQRSLRGQEHRMSVLGFLQQLGVALSPAELQALEDLRSFDPGASSEDFKSFQLKVRQVMSRYKGKGLELLDPNTCIEYSPQVGFSFSVDGIDNLPSDFDYDGLLLLLSHFPHGSFYHSQGHIRKDLRFISLLDYESDARRPRFLDGLLSFHLELDARELSTCNLCMLVDVRVLINSYKLKGTLGQKRKKTEQVTVKQLGFGVLPLFHQGRFLESANFQLPIFAHGADQEQLNSKSAYIYNQKFKVQAPAPYLASPSSSRSFPSCSLLLHLLRLPFFLVLRHFVVHRPM